MTQEVVFCSHEDSHVVMSEKVQSLAGSIYQEFERMIGKYDEEVVKNLMPLVVNVLECLDLAYMENQEHEVELELLREDNEQLITQYEREKQLRKSVEQKLLEMEDSIEDERKTHSNKVESLESIVRMFELKNRNSSDHVSRLEEKEQEMKKEYTKLHERYTELFKTHMDHIERTKLVISSTDKADAGKQRVPSIFGQSNRSSGPVSFGFSSLEPVTHAPVSGSPVEQSVLSNSPQDSCLLTTDVTSNQDAQSAQELSEATANDKIGWSETMSMASKDNSQDEISEDSPPPTKTPSTPGGRTTTQSEKRVGNTLYQELSFQDAEILKEVDDGADIPEFESESETQPSSVNDAFFGMGKEIENLITENNELLATKNALNIVKDDLIAKVDELTSEQEILRETVKSLTTEKSKLKRKVSQLEDELRKVREEAERLANANKAEDDEDVPMAQRKRFTRVEMARVLTERNQFKEKYMELQEAMKWSELVRASKNTSGQMDKKNKQSIWKFFGGLFSPTSEEPPSLKSPQASPSISSPPAHHSTPLTVDSFRKKQIQDRKRGLDFLELSSTCSDKAASRRASERKEQFRQVRAHVSKEDGRLQVYGWSLPAKQSVNPQVTPSSTSSNPPQVPVPVPVYCRPLEEKEPGVKIWCATGVDFINDTNLKSFKSAIVRDMNNGISSPSENEPSSPDSTSVSRSDNFKDAESPPKVSGVKDNPLSSLVWICTSTHSISKVTIFDANNPAEILESFNVCPSHLLCSASIPGASDSAYDDIADQSPRVTESANMSESESTDIKTPEIGTVIFMKEAQQVESKEAVSLEAQVSLQQNAENLSSMQQTIWLGSKSGCIFIHSAVSNWKQCLDAVRLKDSVLHILHANNRVFCALADGTVAVFRRNRSGKWNLNEYFLLVLGPPQHSVRCLLNVNGFVWAASKNVVHIIDPVTLVITNSFVAHPRKDSQIRQMVWKGNGVWISIRLDSTLRLYHAQTLEHLQDVDIEPYVNKMLGTSKLGFSLVRITALLVSCQRLWIGTGNGVIISVPLSNEITGDVSSCSEVDDTTTMSVDSTCPTSNSSFIPYCNMAQAQLSFHGHRDAVKFFVAVPGLGSCNTKSSSEDSKLPFDSALCSSGHSSVLILSGGEGYIDFRIGESTDSSEEKLMAEKEAGPLSRQEQSHLIVWQMFSES
nr:PREDICTED: C-Jun-amino-terminal kinase-interacting protein 3-like isoform X2 [Bemisia tabaci]